MSPMPRYGGPRDANQSDLIQALEQIPGLTVIDLGAVGDDVPDLLIGFMHRNFLVEVKTLTGRLSPGQDKFDKEWPGQTDVCRTLDEILTVIGLKH